MSDQLTQLSKFTQIVADTGDIESIRKYTPVDATTNPSLLFAAAQMKQYEHLVDDAIRYGTKKSKELGQPKRHLELTLDKLAVNFGTEITKIVPGVVSTEVDARLSFDTKATVAKARQLIAMYEENGVPKDRILIKIASTWEGICAARVLEREGIRCNLTLLFSMAQAIACAEAGAYLISPFVGRIMDWYKDHLKVKGFAPEKDPGVISVTNIYAYYKKFGYKTIVMGASFRNKDEILQLAGCDKLTISPQLLQQLKSSDEPVSCILNSDTAAQADIKKIRLDEKAFRYMLNDDACATEKLAQGIRNFAADTVKLEKLIAKRAQAKL